MSQPKRVEAELRRFEWRGDQGIVVHQQIVEGPSSLLDKHLTLRLSFGEIDDLREHVAEAVKRLAESDANPAAANARNAAN